MRGDTSDHSYNAPPSLTIKQNGVTVGTLSTVIAGVNRNLGLALQPVEGSSGTIGIYSDGTTPTILTVTPGANGAMPRQITITG
jgi:hypothetical protein